MKIVIIGSGMGGLSAGIRLAADGHDVTILERNSYAGGKLSEFIVNGYRFDAGPSLFTRPDLVKELFDLCGENFEEAFPYHRLQTLCHYFYEDGTGVQASADIELLARELEEKLQVPASKTIRHLQRAAEMYDLTKPVFLDNSLHKLRTFTSKKAFRALFNLHRIDSLRSMFKSNNRRFKLPKVVQLFNRYATYNGSNPYKAPATLNLIAHLEYNLGAYLPANGMHQITESLVQLAKNNGVEFEFNTPVEKIKLVGNKVEGVEAAGKFYGADVVVSNMDAYYTYLKLLDDEKMAGKILKQERSSSALIFYWGVSQEFRELDVHNIFFAEDYQREFEAIFDAKTLYHDPTVYVHISSKLVISDAPAGGENWFVMINAPARRGLYTEEAIAVTRKQIIAKLERMLNRPIEKFIEAEAVLTPDEIDLKTGSYLGSLYGTSSNSRLAAFLRHPNFSKKIKGLYFCGGSVHPGGGIPLALLSGKIVSNLIQNNSKSK
jgi:phytoene desaturase